MRQYHAASRVLRMTAYPKQATDLTFLLQKPLPNTRHHNIVGNENQQKRPSLSNTVAMKMLANAVRQKKYAEAEQLFQRAPSLGTRQSALRFLIKMYCEQRDFTTAKAILYASFDKVGDRGVARYILHCTFGSQNASDIEEVYSRWCATYEPTPQLAEAALLGTRLLGDLATFDMVWKKTAQYWEPSLKAPTLMSRVLDLLLKENWEDALKVWRIASGMGSFAQVRPLQVFYFACRYFLVENPNVDAVNAILQVMRRLGVKLDTQFTALLLRYLAPMFPDSPVADWIDAAQQRNWPIGDSCAEVLIYALARRYEAVPDLSQTLYQYGSQRMRENGLMIKRHPLAEGTNGASKDLRMLRRCSSDSHVLEYLRSLLSRGLQIPYYHFVVAFRLLVGWRSSKLPELISLIQKQGYPVHCSGIDLAVVELQCREAAYDQIVCKQLVAEYLVQYPLIGHSLSQLTQLGLIMWHAGDYKTALMLVDSIRAEQSSHQKYTGANHDSVSLQLILRCRLSMRDAIVPFIRGVLADQPNIFFDKQFLSSLEEILCFRSEDNSVLIEIEQHNSQLKARCLAEIDNLVSLVRSARQTQPEGGLNSKMDSKAQPELKSALKMRSGLEQEDSNCT